MERLRTEQPKGLSRAGLRKWAMLFAILGIFGRSILLNRFLGIDGMTGDQLLEAMSGGSGVMIAVTVGLICLFLETCAVPIFCLLLADGMANTSSAEKYIARVLGVAALSELPFNFAMSGNMLDATTRNPVFGMLMALILVYLYQRFAEKKFVNYLLKAAFTVAALVWCGMLKIESGACCVILTAVFWGFRKKTNIRNLMAGGAAMLCSMFSIFYMVAPMSLVVIHFYNGEKGEENRMVSYLFYPAVLTIIGIAGALAF